jgi:RTX calcium-binding nonapeptide repeat (4 copies)
VTFDSIPEDSIQNIENVIGGSGADSITGDNLDNVIEGRFGNDTIDGGGGNDTAVFASLTHSKCQPIGRLQPGGWNGNRHRSDRQRRKCRWRQPQRFNHRK